MAASTFAGAWPTPLDGSQITPSSSREQLLSNGIIRILSLEDIEKLDVESLNVTEAGAVMERVNQLIEILNRERKELDLEREALQAPLSPLLHPAGFKERDDSGSCHRKGAGEGNEGTAPLARLDDSGKEHCRTSVSSEIDITSSPLRSPGPELDTPVDAYTAECAAMRQAMHDECRRVAEKELLETYPWNYSTRHGTRDEVSDAMRQRQQQQVDAVVASISPPDPSVHARLTLLMAARKLQQMRAKLQAMDEYWAAHKEWLHRVEELDAEKQRKSDRMLEAAAASGPGGSGKASRSGRAHLLGGGTASPFGNSPSNASLGGSSAQGSGGGSRRPRELYARSEEDVVRMIQQIEDSKEERIHRLAADIPDLEYNVQMRRDRTKELRNVYSDELIERVLDEELGPVSIPDFLGARKIQNPLAYYQAKKLSKIWPPEEEALFVKSFMNHSKDFKKIAEDMNGKATGQVVTFYYLNKHRFQLKKNYKRHRRVKMMERGGKSSSRWTSAETETIKSAIVEIGKEDLKALSERIKTKTIDQCRNWIHNHKDFVNRVTSKRLRGASAADELDEPLEPKKKRKRVPSVIATPTSTPVGNSEVDTDPGTVRGLRRRKGGAGNMEIDDDDANGSRASVAQSPKVSAARRPQDGASPNAVPASPVAGAATAQSAEKPKLAPWKQWERERAGELFAKIGPDFHAILPELPNKTLFQIQRFHAKWVKLQKSEKASASNTPADSAAVTPDLSIPKSKGAALISQVAAANEHAHAQKETESAGPSSGSLTPNVSKSGSQSGSDLTPPKRRLSLTQANKPATPKAPRRRVQSHRIPGETPLMGTMTCGIPTEARPSSPLVRRSIPPPNGSDGPVSSTPSVKSVGSSGHQGATVNAQSSSYANATTPSTPKSMAAHGLTFPPGALTPAPMPGAILAASHASTLASPHALSQAVAAQAAAGMLAVHPPHFPHGPPTMHQAHLHPPPIPPQYPQYGYAYAPYPYFYRDYAHAPSSAYYRPAPPYPSLQRSYQLYPSTAANAHPHAHVPHSQAHLTPHVPLSAAASIPMTADLVQLARVSSPPLSQTTPPVGALMNVPLVPSVALAGGLPPVGMALALGSQPLPNVASGSTTGRSKGPNGQSQAKPPALTGPSVSNGASSSTSASSAAAPRARSTSGEHRQTKQSTPSKSASAAARPPEVSAPALMDSQVSTTDGPSAPASKSPPAANAVTTGSKAAPIASHAHPHSLPVVTPVAALTSVPATIPESVPVPAAKRTRSPSTGMSSSSPAPSSTRRSSSSAFPPPVPEATMVPSMVSASSMPQPLLGPTSDVTSSCSPSSPYGPLPGASVVPSYPAGTVTSSMPVSVSLSVPTPTTAVFTSAGTVGHSTTNTPVSVSGMLSAPVLAVSPPTSPTSPISPPYPPPIPPAPTITSHCPPPQASSAIDQVPGSHPPPITLPFPPGLRSMALTSSTDPISSTPPTLVPDHAMQSERRDSLSSLSAYRSNVIVEIGVPAHGRLPSTSSSASSPIVGAGVGRLASPATPATLQPSATAGSSMGTSSLPSPRRRDGSPLGMSLPLPSARHLGASALGSGTGPSGGVSVTGGSCSGAAASAHAPIRPPEGKCAADDEPLPTLPPISALALPAAPEATLPSPAVVSAAAAATVALPRPFRPSTPQDPPVGSGSGSGSGSGCGSGTR